MSKNIETEIATTKKVETEKKKKELTRLHLHDLRAWREYPISEKPSNSPIIREDPLSDPATTTRFSVGPKPTHPPTHRLRSGSTPRSYPFLQIKIIKRSSFLKPLKEINPNTPLRRYPVGKGFKGFTFAQNRWTPEGEEAKTPLEIVMDGACKGRRSKRGRGERKDLMGRWVLWEGFLTFHGGGGHPWQHTRESE